jgi:SPP1 family predicted phage head-tail adaptor
MVRIGSLRHRIRLQENRLDLVDRDETGGKVDNWGDVATVWGDVEELRGREYLTSREFHAEITARIFIRYRAGLEPLRWRAVHDETGRTYDIHHVIDRSGRRRTLELLVSLVT